MRITTPIGMLPRGPQTGPSYFDGYSANNLGVVARRGWDGRTTAYLEDVRVSGVEGLRQWCQEAPLRLLEVLVDLHPMGQMADSNDKTLAFAPGSTRIVALKDYQTGRGTPDDDATRLIADMLDASGGITHLQHVMAAQVNIFGLAAIEVVIDRERGSLTTPHIVDIDPLSLRYRDTERGRVLEQRNHKARDGWQTLDTATIYHRAWMSDRKNPYGKPRYGAFLSEGLADIAEQRNLKDWLHAAAWPRLAFSFPFEEMAQYAEDHPEVLIGMGPEVDGVRGDLTASDWALGQMQAFAQKMATMKADDIILSPAGSDSKVLSAGSVTGLADVLEIRRLRVIQSLDQLPTLMGVTDGGTQAYALANWGTQSKKLATLRTIPNEGLVFAANLFLRLLGIDMIARADTEPIHSIDPLGDARARQQDIANELLLMDRGLQSPEEVALTLTGTGVFDLSRVYGASPTVTDPATLPGGDEG